MKQKVLQNSQEVFSCLLEEIENSKYEILAAVAFFTNAEILQKLIEKANQGVKISIIIADELRNNKLDFNKLTQYNSAEVIKKKLGGYNIMNQKFCVIDRKIVIQGSYNWTLNANNEDSALFTTDKQTVKSYLKIFFNSAEKEWELVKNRSLKNVFSWFPKLRKKVIIEKQTQEVAQNKTIENDPVKESINQKYDVDEILNSIITAEIETFDREVLNADGYHSAKKVQGDANVLVKKMDTLYHLFINDKNNVDEQKKSLKDKIKDKIEELIIHVSSLFQNKERLERTNFIAKEKEYQIRKVQLEGEIKLKIEEAKSIDDTKINELEIEIKAIEEEIKKLDPDLLKPIKKRYVFIPRVILAVILGIGLFLFYASCAYILFYAEQDILQAMNTGGKFKIGIFVANSLELSWKAGGVFAMIYAALFFTIPYAIGFITHDLKAVKKYGAWLLIFVIDALIAINVSNTINRAGGTFGSNIKHSFISPEKLPEYIIILFLGLIPMVILVIITKEIIKYYDDNHPERGRLIKELEKKQLTNDALELDGQIFELCEHKDSLQHKIIELQNEKNTIDIEEVYLPKELDEKLLGLEEEKKGEIRYMEKKRDLYVNAVDNDSIRISANALKDRVNIFLEGWNQWLHEEFSRELAIQRSDEARQVADAWMSQNLDNSELLNQNVLKI